MKKLIFTALVVCTLQMHAMQMADDATTRKTSHQKKSCSDTCGYWAKAFCIATCCVLATTEIAKNVYPHDTALSAADLSMQKEWDQMHSDCWDPCLTHRWYQPIHHHDDWLERIWDTRINKYQDELNCPGHERGDEIRHLYGCSTLEQMEQNDEMALQCIEEDIEAKELSATIKQIKKKIIKRSSERQACRAWPKYLEWKKEGRKSTPLEAGIRGEGSYSPCYSSPYHTILHTEDYQPRVVDIRLCRSLKASECSEYDPTRSLIESLHRRGSCENLEEKPSDDGSLPPFDKIMDLYRINRRYDIHEITDAQRRQEECRIWEKELQKKNQ